MSRLAWAQLSKNCEKSEAEKILRLLLLAQATHVRSKGIFSALRRVKTYLRSTMGNKRLHELMLMHVPKNFD